MEKPWLGIQAAPAEIPVAPPTSSRDSTTRTRAPSFAAVRAAISPAPPDPTIATSTSSGMPCWATVPMDPLCWVELLVMSSS